MKDIKLTKEQIDQLSYDDVAYMILTNYGKKMQIADLFKAVIKSLELPESYFESKITEFFGLLSTDKRFTMLEKGFWDLKENHKSKVVIEDDDDEDVDLEETEEDLEEEEIDEEEINYDDEDLTDDDEEEDAYKDLVIMNEGEEEESQL